MFAVHLCKWVCSNQNRSLGIKYCFFYSFCVYTCVFLVCECVWLYKVCKNVCVFVLNNHFTIFSCYSRKIWLEFGADKPEIPPNGVRNVGRPLNYYDFCFRSLASGWMVLFTCELFSSLHLLIFDVFANKTCFCSHFERARFSGMNENASTLCQHLLHVLFFV